MMKQTSQWAGSSMVFMSTWVLALCATVVAPVGGEETKGSDVGTRAVPGAPPQQGQMPTFPQKFEVRGPETDSFGFPVTQPGPIMVDVQTQGAPVMVTLQNVAGPPMARQGTGHVQLAYQVTPQDIQKSALWIVRIKLAQPGPAPLGSGASGSVMVQHPPADPAVVQAQVAAAAAQIQGDRQRGEQETQARFNQQFQAIKAKVEQEGQQRQAAERAKNQPLLDRLRVMAGSRIRSRGIEGESPAAEGNDVTTRGTGLSTLSPLSPSATTPLKTAPQAGMTAISPPPPPPPPIIDHLNKTQGLPKDQVIIYGKNFGNAGGDVVFHIGPTTSLPGVVEAWSDTVIVADVPDASGLLQFDGGVFIPMGQIQSNTVPFRFIPAQEVRMSHSAKGDVSLAQPGSYSQNVWDHIKHPNTTFMRLGGSKGNDVIFPTARLKNGWVVQEINVSTAGCVCSDGVVVAVSRVGTDTLFFNARWWYDALSDADYNFAVWIIGPRGVPDGLVVP